MLHDVDVYVDGMNARPKARDAPQAVAAREMFAANAVIGEIFGQGGGDEARRSEFLSSLR